MAVSAIMIASGFWDDPCLNTAGSTFKYPQWMRVYGAILGIMNSLLGVLILHRACENCESGIHSRVYDRLIVALAIMQDLFYAVWWVLGVILWSQQVHNYCVGPLADLGAALIGIEAGRLLCSTVYLFCFDGWNDARALWDGDSAVDYF